MNVWKFGCAIGLMCCLVLGEAFAQRSDPGNRPPGSGSPDEQVGPRPPGSPNPRSWVGANTNPTAQVGTPRPIANQPRPMVGPDSTMPVPIAGGLPGAATWDLCNDPNASNYMALGPCVYSPRPGPGPGGGCPPGSPTPQQCAAGGASYSSSQCSCLCGSGLVWSGGANGRCVCPNTWLPPVNGQCSTGGCPPGSPTPDQCAAGGASYNPSQCSCLCVPGLVWSGGANGRCVCPNTGLPPVNGSCTPGNTGQCPPGSPTQQQCQAGGGVNYNPDQCTCSCPQGQTWSSANGRCVCSNTGLPPVNGSCTPGNTGQCPPGSPTPQQCQANGASYNPDQCTCTCQSGAVWDNSGNRCVCTDKNVPPNTNGLVGCDCPPGKVWNGTSCVCDPNQMQISPAQCAAGGGTFNDSTCSCTCPQGLVLGTDHYTGQLGCLCPGKYVRPGTAGLMDNSCDCPADKEWSDYHRRCVPKCQNGFVLNGDGTGCECLSGVVINGTHCCVEGDCVQNCGRASYATMLAPPSRCSSFESRCTHRPCVRRCVTSASGARCVCDLADGYPMITPAPELIGGGSPDCLWSFDICGC